MLPHGPKEDDWNALPEAQSEDLWGTASVTGQKDSRAKDNVRQTPNTPLACMSKQVTPNAPSTVAESKARGFRSPAPSVKTNTRATAFPLRQGDWGVASNEPDDGDVNTLSRAAEENEWGTTPVETKQDNWNALSSSVSQDNWGAAPTGTKRDDWGISSAVAHQEDLDVVQIETKQDNWKVSSSPKNKDGWETSPILKNDSTNSPMARPVTKLGNMSSPVATPMASTALNQKVDNPSMGQYRSGFSSPNQVAVEAIDGDRLSWKGLGTSAQDQDAFIKVCLSLCDRYRWLTLSFPVHEYIF
ncbi:hypothetical protein BDZ91DRAFT_711298 [Kalaharituber pfeilii]|nr:hypothetical protein BDZ91DRAFT_711298 [Kalaharituber pfeilii]